MTKKKNNNKCPGHYGTVHIFLLLNFYFNLTNISEFNSKAFLKGKFSFMLKTRFIVLHIQCKNISIFVALFSTNILVHLR